MWQNIKEIACGLFVAALQLTSRPMPKRKQCPGCLRAHSSATMHCTRCEAVLLVRELLRAAVYCFAGFALTITIWLLWR